MFFLKKYFISVSVIIIKHNALLKNYMPTRGLFTSIDICHQETTAKIQLFLLFSFPLHIFLADQIFLYRQRAMTVQPHNMLF